VVDTAPRSGACGNPYGNNLWVARCAADGNNNCRGEASAYGDIFMGAVEPPAYEG